MPSANSISRAHPNPSKKESKSVQNRNYIHHGTSASVSVNKCLHVYREYRLMHAQHTRQDRILFQMTWKSVYPVLRGCGRPMKTIVLVSYWGEAVNVQLLKLWHTPGHVTRLWLCSTSDSARVHLSQQLYKAWIYKAFVYIAIYTVQIVSKQLRWKTKQKKKTGK